MSSRRPPLFLLHLNPHHASYFPPPHPLRLLHSCLGSGLGPHRPRQRQRNLPQGSSLQEPTAIGGAERFGVNLFLSFRAPACVVLTSNTIFLSPQPRLLRPSDCLPSATGRDPRRLLRLAPARRAHRWSTVRRAVCRSEHRQSGSRHRACCSSFHRVRCSGSGSVQDHRDVSATCPDVPFFPRTLAHPSPHLFHIDRGHDGCGGIMEVRLSVTPALARSAISLARRSLTLPPSSLPSLCLRATHSPKPRSHETQATPSLQVCPFLSHSLSFLSPSYPHRPPFPFPHFPLLVPFRLSSPLPPYRRHLAPNHPRHDAPHPPHHEVRLAARHPKANHQLGPPNGVRPQQARL